MTSILVLVLLGFGGIFYSTGVAFYLNKRLQYAKAIWHGHVLVAVAGGGLLMAAPEVLLRATAPGFGGQR